SALQFEGVSFEFSDFGGGNACASLIALDEQPIAQSRRLLLTVAGRAQNAHRPEPLAPGARSDLGAGPALAQYVPFTLGLPPAAWRASALNSAGGPTQALTVVTARQSTIRTTLAGAALSYSITR
ncbi:MAG: hypothetical protein ABW061_02880, partial [Polyangiaceae bacterium]